MKNKHKKIGEYQNNLMNIVLELIDLKYYNCADKEALQKAVSTLLPYFDELSLRDEEEEIAYQNPIDLKWSVDGDDLEWSIVDDESNKPT